MNTCYENTFAPFIISRRSHAGSNGTSCRPKVHGQRNGGWLDKPRGRTIRHDKHSQKRKARQGRKDGRNRQRRPLQRDDERQGQLRHNHKLHRAQSHNKKLQRDRRQKGYRPRHALHHWRQERTGGRWDCDAEAACEGRYWQNWIRHRIRSRLKVELDNRNAAKGAACDSRRRRQRNRKRKQLVQGICERTAQQHDDQEPERGAEEHAGQQHKEDRGDNRPGT